MTRRCAIALVGVGIGLLAWGCVPPPPCGLHRCDIRQAACQSLVAANTSCLREEPLLQVPVTVVSREDYVNQQIAQTMTPQNDQSFEAWNTGLALLGLSRRDATSADTASTSAGNVAAFYSPKDKSITIVDGGQGFDSRIAVSTLAHEYTHALQDAAVGFEALSMASATDLDHSLAAYAVTEGEATVIQDLVEIGLFGDDANDIPWTRVFTGWEAETRRNSAASPFPVTLAWMYFHYPFGTPFVHAALAAGGWQVVDRLRVSPPTGTREVIAGFGAVEASGGPWAEDLGADAVPALAEPFQYLDADRMGAWILEQFAARLTPRPTAPIGDLRGDALSMFRDQITGGVLAVWRLRFPSAESAALLIKILADSTPAGPSDVAIRSLQLDRDVLVIAAQNADLLAAVPEQLTFGPVPPRPSQPAMQAAWTRIWGCSVRPTD